MFLMCLIGVLLLKGTIFSFGGIKVQSWIMSLSNLEGLQFWDAPHVVLFNPMAIEFLIIKKNYKKLKIMLESCELT